MAGRPCRLASVQQRRNAMANPETRIGATLVGRGRRPMIVAELSANHNASLDRALQIVQAAAECGAHAIKLQTYQPEALTIDSHRPEFFIDDPDGLWHGRRLLELYRQAHTPWQWHRPIFDAARAAGLACISTAFDLGSLEFLISLGVDAIKIASFELIHIPLLAAAAKCGRPVLVSTGMASLEELDEAVSALRANGCSEFILLKCTSAYPSSESDANVLTMSDMRGRYRCDVGLSDHTLRPYAAFAATSHGAVVIEKHFTMARRDGGLDSAFSIEPAELRELVDGTEAVWRSLGEARYGQLAAERASVKERPSIYVVRAMKKGDRFTDQNLRIIRPANGLAPRYYGSLIGKTCARDIAAGVPLSWELVENGATGTDKQIGRS
jgi:N-acetylneuraminate synthase